MHRLTDGLLYIEVKGVNGKISFLPKKHQVFKNGRVVFGPNTRRKLTIKEAIKAGIATSKAEVQRIWASTPHLLLKETSPDEFK